MTFMVAGRILLCPSPHHMSRKKDGEEGKMAVPWEASKDYVSSHFLTLPTALAK